MNGVTHRKIAHTCGLALASTITMEPTIDNIVVTLIGTLALTEFGAKWIDFDHATSKMQQELGLAGKILRKPFGKRSRFTHSLDLHLICLFLYMYFAANPANVLPVLLMTVGTVSHILADMLTVEGAYVMFFLPPLHLTTARTGRTFEEVVYKIFCFLFQIGIIAFVASIIGRVFFDYTGIFDLIGGFNTLAGK